MFIEDNKTSFKFVYEGKVETHDTINFGNNETKALDFFKYGAENTNIEFNVSTENNISFAGTSHMEKTVALNVINPENVTLFGHSHPNITAELKQELNKEKYLLLLVA